VSPTAQLALPGFSVCEPSGRSAPWPFRPRADLAVEPEPTPEDYLRAAERRAQLQSAYHTWLAAGRPRWGDLLDRMAWVAEQHRSACHVARV
jgi:hypothetical protein